MKYFDLHCDTVTAMADGNTDTAVSLKKTTSFERYSQAFAIWLDDSVSAEAAFEKACGYYRYYKEHILFSSNSRFTPFLTLENAVSFGNDINNIAFWRERCVKTVTLTWNGANSLGFGCGFPCESGLTAFGKEALSEMNRQGIIADVSHLNRQGFYDCLSLSKLPVIASHSNCQALCFHERNLDDKQLKALFSSGGLLGICFYPLFLGTGNVFELLYEHIYHALLLGGEKSVCFGSDFDGAKMARGLDSLEKVTQLWSYLSEKGFGNELLEKIFYDNAHSFFQTVA